VIYLIIIITVAILIILDQYTKWLARKKLLFGKYKKISGLLFLILKKNKGGFYGIGKNHSRLVKFAGLFLIFLCIAIMTGLYLTGFSDIVIIGLSFLIAGGTSNTIDRFSRGYVTDFIYIKVGKKTPVFNFADIYIFTGLLLYFIGVVFSEI
jgi:signal peptidase II